MDSGNDCLTCRSLSGEAPLAPGPAVHGGRFWVIEHAYPCRLKGWLVIVLRRHAPALHELTGEEWAELADLQQRAALFLRREVGCEKEYVMCFAESPRHQHVHVHVVGKPADLPAGFKGSHIFGLMAASESEPDVVPRDEITAFCEQLRQRWFE